MKNVLKISVSIMLIFAMSISFASCSKKVEMTEESIRETVDIVNVALKDFDIDSLEKYVDSQTLSYILKFAKEHQQFADLGKALFENLTMEAESVDVEDATVTVKVHNKKLDLPASDFANDLNDNYSTMQLLNLLNDDSFLDSKLKVLNDRIAQTASELDSTVTLKVTKGKKNLVLTFDEQAENAVSGGALTAIKSIYN